MHKVLICGFGSIGQKHARNLNAMSRTVGVWRTRSAEIQNAEQQGDNFFVSLQEGLAWCDAVLIATSTDRHIEIALQAAKLKKPYYLEKPVSLSLEGLEELQQASQDLIVEVGCQLRQHPALKAFRERLKTGQDGKVLAFQAWVGQRLDEWRPGTDYRSSYSADAARGGGALFDLVHEIDLMTWLVGPMRSVYADLRHNSDLEIKADDLANMVLVAQNKAAGTVQLDMLSPAYRRGLQIVTEKCLFSFDMLEGILWRRAGQETEILYQSPSEYKPAQMLYDAVAYFIKRLENPALPSQCSLQEGIHDLHILLAACKSSQTAKNEMIQVQGEGL